MSNSPYKVKKNNAIRIYSIVGIIIIVTSTQLVFNSTMQAHFGSLFLKKKSNC